MSERTTIGGTVYEAIGSSSSNLLLRCNGTARIQWGGKLIDLIKNGKIASSDSKELIFTVSSESEIKSDGVYILTTGESNYLWICKDGVKYDLTNTDLYISASKPQNLTSEQKKQALDNIGMYYNTLKEVEDAKIQHGLVYVLENKTLYTIQDGVITEFEAKLKTVEVDNVNTGEDVIKGKVKLVLSILDDEYLILADQRITANYSIHVKESAQVGSEGADKNQGYRLYIDRGVSWLDVDKINVRHGFDVDLYKKVEFHKFISDLSSGLLEPHEWYLIIDFQNHWRLKDNSDVFNRPILVRALTENSIYEWGYLFRDHRIKIKYDPTFQDSVKTSIKDESGNTTESLINSRGKITWMWDTRNNNQANFDFMDYTVIEDNKETTVRHNIQNDDSQDKSIFPFGSHDNTLIAYDLKNTVLVNGVFNNDNTNEINFKYNDQDFNNNTNPTEVTTMDMYNNFIECRGLVIEPTCSVFCNNTVNKAIKLNVHYDFIGNTLKTIYFREDRTNIDFNVFNFETIPDSSAYNTVTFQHDLENVTCEEFKHCTFLTSIVNSNFGIIENTIFNKSIENSTITSIIRPTSEYVYNLYSINNSNIREISLEAEFSPESIINNSIIDIISEQASIIGTIENSNINTIINKCTIPGSIKNSTILEISQEATVKGNIDNCTINKIYSPVVIDGTISNSSINDISGSSQLEVQIDNTSINDIINGSTVKATINFSNINNIDSSTIESEINRSTFYDIIASTIKSNITNSTFNNINTTEITGPIYNINTFDVYNSFLYGELNECTFINITGVTINSKINKSKFLDIIGGEINASIGNCTFKTLNVCSFAEGSVNDSVSFYDLSEQFNPEDHYLLYNTAKRKEIYIHNGKLQIICVPDVIFYRGMIIMHSGIEEIPNGWALCDGNEYEWNGLKSKTPDLRNRFIRATETLNTSEVKATDNEDINDKDELIIKKEQLPKHKHEIDITKLPQYTTDEIEGNTSRYDPKSQYVNTDSGTLSVGVSVSVYVSVSVGESSDSDSDSSSDSDSITLSGTTLNYLGQGANYESIAHKHKINWGADNLVTEENDKTEEQKPIKPIPSYYSLIFIMKL